jgi:hypothetical protein
MAITRMSNLGIASLGSEKYNDMLAGNPPYIPSDFESIATVNVGAGGTASMSFTSIPSTYTHLQLRINARSTSTSANGIVMGMRFNGDTASNYSLHYLSAYQGIASGVESSAIANANQMYAAVFAADGNAASIFGSAFVDILDYKNTNKSKTIRSLTGYDINGSTSGYSSTTLYSGNWRSNSAITSIEFTLVAGDYAQYSSFALYGIRG